MDNPDYSENKSALIAKWNQRYGSATKTEMNNAINSPAEVLTGNDYLLPKTGKALEVACGLGANAVFLARHGLAVQAWDIAPSAITFLTDYARQQQLAVTASCYDVETTPIPPAEFDVIVVSYFLSRDLFPQLLDALRNGGLLYYQTFIQDKATPGGPGNPEYLLGNNELLEYCRPLRVLYYLESGSVGDLSRGLRNEALIVARKE